MGQLIIIVAMLALMWFLLIRPQRQRQVTQNRMLASLSVGDEIVTAGGLYGEIRRLDEEDVHVEIAPGTVVRVAKRAIAGVMRPEEDEPADQPDVEDELADDQELETTTGAADSTGPTRS